jgi:hypothetical protein
VDSIDSMTFWIVDTFAKDCLPGGKKASKKKAAAAPVNASASSLSKKARVG